MSNLLRQKSIDQVVAALKRCPLVFMTGLDPEKVDRLKTLIDVCIEKGMQTLELLDRMIDLPLQSRLDAFSALQTHADGRLILGVGTMTSRAQVAGFVELRPDFVVSPISNQVLSPFDDENILCIRGGATASEVRMIQDGGNQVIKGFPANTPKNLSTVLALGLDPDRQVVLLGTGGVKYDNLGDWAKIRTKRPGCIIGVGFGNEFESEIHFGDFRSIHGEKLEKAVEMFTIAD